MQEFVKATKAGETEKAVCLACQCEWKMQTVGGIEIGVGDVDLWFPKGKEWPDSGHVKLEGNTWFARTWILKKNEEKEADKRKKSGCISFGIQIKEEEGAQEPPSEHSERTSASIPNTPVNTGFDDPDSDTLPF